ncbi:LEAF RUST 10 DISEASE-RESISTANCE LOCUS RECEPTOR-LIKE PROTEIN KINASE-like 1.1 isoform X2 [Salvia splendens]|uniref:LEAF RUST 10 DISEASE-RESISTANCE LOCUS RECEPTOR-LIKE PROTEIN KINASE-like 1.1 isoform X2 n=1 Tax=Salvia splendens TaxID=180675 RepID=UPI001C27E6FC|nr:LEAF RUST 10 DISEASE-RESISTANCE LOCUS RECEPTOR-LIKE PROTEIN KINASE-like 1.1 isoform X2 [Salvia splendens]
MGKTNIFLFLLSCHLLFPTIHSKCPKSFRCGNLGILNFPFTSAKNSKCGLFFINDCGSESPRLRFSPEQTELGGGDYKFVGVNNLSTNEFTIYDSFRQKSVKDKSCNVFQNLPLSQSSFVSFSFSPNITFFTCWNATIDPNVQDYFRNRQHINASCQAPPTVYYSTLGQYVPTNSSVPAMCSMVQLPTKSNSVTGELFDVLSAEFTLKWNVSQECYDCYGRGGQCVSDNSNKFKCKEEENKLRKKILLATLIPGSALLLACALYIWLRKKKKVGSYLLSRNLSYDPSSKADIEDGSFNFGIPIFSYNELVEATGNFDPSKELGDGGFGTVYYGKLRDGREVAIKRLYEHNYRRVEQFLNEIKILTSLRHPNLVSLYGCTSRRSRELLLVYEYIPNGTVADHLHGQRATSAPLTWPMRMTIARETATALAYLHKSDIIHRDVKTNNILLDANFSVKVADFGLSRLFPNDVTHISTAPQGTPGYVDPEYHQCYQLTDKSDVYSFGVVLIELISSMPAVDISRHKHEINLANLAVSKIQKCAFDELIDPATGYNSDAEVTRMTTTVAELAFRCLQLDKDMRPTMEEVVAFLHDIESGGDGDFEGMKGNSGGKIPPSPETDEVGLLKSRIYRSSPTAVTDTWISSASTTASSVG